MEWTVEDRLMSILEACISTADLMYSVQEARYGFWAHKMGDVWMTRMAAISDDAMMMLESSVLCDSLITMPDPIPMRIALPADE